MKINILKKWVAALRSGKYKQGTGELRTINDGGLDQFCCLGVLCDLHAKATGGKWRGKVYKGADNVLPDTVSEWAGLNSNNPEVYPIDGGHEERSAAGLNDDGRGFKTIANLIEKAQKQKLI